MKDTMCDTATNAIKKFKDMKSDNPKVFDRQKIQKSAKEFDEKLFKEKLKRFVDAKLPKN